MVVSLVMLGSALSRLALCSLVALLWQVRPALAQDDRVAEHARELARNTDFRVRTQAALALGAARSDKAVEPLCSALSDEHIAVRAAAGAALGKLQKGGVDCLQRRIKDEKSATVQAILVRSLQKLQSSGGGRAGSEPAITSSTRLYIALDKTKDATARGGDAVHELVRAALIQALEAQTGCVVAPEGESKAQFQKRLGGKKQISSFFLAAKVLPPKYEDGSLVIRFEIAIFTYPDKSLKGMIPVKLTQPGVSSPDRDSEDELMRKAAERAVEKFMKSLDKLQ